jgi:hypothetical protein
MKIIAVSMSETATALYKSLFLIAVSAKRDFYLSKLADSTIRELATALNKTVNSDKKH